MTDVPKTEAQDSVKVEDKSDFVKLISDFTKDVLTTFPELADSLDESLRQIVIAPEGETPNEDAMELRVVQVLKYTHLASLTYCIKTQKSLVKVVKRMFSSCPALTFANYGHRILAIARAILSGSICN